MAEHWKSVADYEGLYEVSDLGRVRRLARFQLLGNRWGTLSSRFLPEQILQPVRSGNRGYLSVGLWKDGQSRLTRVNVLVCETFHGPRPAGQPCALHTNGDQDDNRAPNLRWGSDKDNACDRERHGRTAKGERQHSARLTAPLVRTIRARAANGERIAPIAREFGVHPSSIHAAVKRETWKHVA